MILAVTKAAIKYNQQSGNKKTDANDPNNPFQIKYSVYNLYDDSYVHSLINAYKAGVYVQVLVNKSSLVGKGYNHTYEEFEACGLSVQKPENTSSQKTITIKNKHEFDTLNLILIEPRGSLMHCKTRYYKFGPDAVPVNIGDVNKNITEAVVTGSFNPECAATTNNEYLIVLSSSKTKTPDTIQSYLRIYDYVKHDKSNFQTSAPPLGDTIYNLNKAIYVCYSGWCKNSGGSYMRKIMMDLIDKETQAILIPTYTMSNLDVPDMYKNPIKLNGNFSYVPPSTTGNYWGVLSGITNSKTICSLGYNGIGAQVDIDYTIDSDKGKTKTLTCFIRDKVDSGDINLIQTGRTLIKNTDNMKIKGITVYATMLTHYGCAINRGVKVILTLAKSEVDGGPGFTGGDSSQTAFLMQQMGAILYRCENPHGELHVKNGYFYSQNKLITDTTNWSNAGMGHEDKSGANCSQVNSETCLVISVNDLTNKDIIRTRILSNFTNILRLYAYQQNCKYNESDWKNWGGVNNSKEIINYSNCECPKGADISCQIGKCINNKKEMSPSRSCTGGTKDIPTYGADVVNCCLRWGQTEPKQPHDYNSIITILSKLPNWPVFKVNDNKYYLGEIIKSSNDSIIIIDPVFDWGKGVRINDKDLKEVIDKNKILFANLNPLPKGVAQFCTKTFTCVKKKKYEEEIGASKCPTWMGVPCC